MESRMARVVMVDRPRAPAPALSIAAIGASSMGVAGGLPVWAPVSELTQRISRKSRITCRKVNSGADRENAEDEPVQAGIGAEGERDLLVEDENDKTDQRQERRHADQENARRGEQTDIRILRHGSPNRTSKITRNVAPHHHNRLVGNAATDGDDRPPPRLARSTDRHATFNLGFSQPRLTRTSAICTALSAAPLRRLSDTIQRLRPLSIVGSSRMREI